MALLNDIISWIPLQMKKFLENTKNGGKERKLKKVHFPDDLPDSEKIKEHDWKVLTEAFSIIINGRDICDLGEADVRFLFHDHYHSSYPELKKNLLNHVITQLSYESSSKQSMQPLEKRKRTLSFESVKSKRSKRK